MMGAIVRWAVMVIVAMAAVFSLMIFPRGIGLFLLIGMKVLGILMLVLYMFLFSIWRDKLWR